MSVEFYIEYAINITNLHALMRYHLLKHSLSISVNFIIINHLQNFYYLSYLSFFFLIEIGIIIFLCCSKRKT